MTSGTNCHRRLVNFQHYVVLRSIQQFLAERYVTRPNDRLYQSICISWQVNISVYHRFRTFVKIVCLRPNMLHWVLLCYLLHDTTCARSLQK